MNFSKEMIEKAKTASSAEDLLEMAKANGIELSEAEAETYFSFLKDNGPLSDEELEQVAGGKGDKPKPPPPPKYLVGQKVMYYSHPNVPCYGYVTSRQYSDFQKAWYYYCVFENGLKEEAALEDPSCGFKVVR